ncbi:MAG TPA: TonB-dependent receptor plug domain-containing protein [Steroidobacteraceae bacterium]|nr:TonB-dependent receptor plug domain-containing protein [Steroidobacteraceae bacterium]
MKSHWALSAPFAAFIFLAQAAVSADDTLDEIVVTAGLRSTSVADLPQSVTVIGADTLRDAGVQHFEDVLGLIPDLNWAAGTSRPRFFQLRGIGEVEQYQGAPNPSVGFLIDDIDFSGVGMPATLFDTQQIEVLRGPQGTAYGANALAGLISVRTVDPGRDFELNGEVTGADYDTRAASLAVGDGFAAGNGGWRLVAQQYLSDGFRHNAYLDENSTNGFDEGTLRGKLRWQITDALRADLTLMHVNIDNGYDAWSVYNTYTTYSNQPGRDAQLSNGAALRLVDSIEGVGELRSVTSTADSKITYSFDGDWGNDAFWLATTGYAPYDFFQSDNRTRRTVAEDLRMTGDPSDALFGRLRWLAGIYALRLTESDQQVFTWDAYDAGLNGGPGTGSSGLASKYSATNVALYGSLEANVGARSVLSGGLRVERRVADYSDSADIESPFPEQTNHMVGGNVSWETATGDGEHVYATLARGYKGGGFNIGSGILSEQRSFDPESLWSLETGLKYAEAMSPLQLQTDVFYMRRQNMQVYLSEQLQQNNPLAYVFYTQNASSGENYGLEGEAAYRLSDRWQISGSGSLLHTRYLGVSGLFSSLDIDGRAQPFAPSYKLSAAVEYRHPSGWFARLDASAIGSFYYYTSDAQASRAYNLENARVGYEHGSWSGSLWVRNLFGASYAQQGFYFGLIPPNYPNQSFLQLGDPRQVGITIDYRLGQGH